METTISAIDQYKRKRIQILDSEIAFIDVGEGDPIVFLHGNPTSSYLWRNVIPHLEGLGRCLAPDLIGMGESAKLPNSNYEFSDHVRYLDEWFDELQLNNVTLVLHDFGTALGFHWANRHRDRVKAIAHMEGFVRPLSFEEWPDAAKDFLKGVRSSAGEKLILEENVILEQIFPITILRQLTAEEMEAYHRPFLEAGESRRPMLTFPRSAPVAGQPENVNQLVQEYADWLSTSTIPKLFVNAEPGMFCIGAQREFCRTWPNQQEVTVKGVHFIQEDSPQEIGQAVAQFVKGL